MTEASVQSLEDRIKALEDRIKAIEEAGGQCLFDDCNIETVNIYQCAKCRRGDDELPETGLEPD